MRGGCSSVRWGLGWEAQGSWFKPWCRQNMVGVLVEYPAFTHVYPPHDARREKAVKKIRKELNDELQQVHTGRMSLPHSRGHWSTAPAPLWWSSLARHQCCNQFKYFLYNGCRQILFCRKNQTSWLMVLACFYLDKSEKVCFMRSPLGCWCQTCLWRGQLKGRCGVWSAEARQNGSERSARRTSRPRRTGLRGWRGQPCVGEQGSTTSWTGALLYREMRG